MDVQRRRTPTEPWTPDGRTSEFTQHITNVTEYFYSAAVLFPVSLFCSTSQRTWSDWTWYWRTLWTSLWTQNHPMDSLCSEFVCQAAFRLQLLSLCTTRETPAAEPPPPPQPGLHPHFSIHLRTASILQSEEHSLLFSWGGNESLGTFLHVQTQRNRTSSFGLSGSLSLQDFLVLQGHFISADPVTPVFSAGLMSWEVEKKVQFP